MLQLLVGFFRCNWTSHLLETHLHPHDKAIRCPTKTKTAIRRRIVIPRHHQRKYAGKKPRRPLMRFVSYQ